MSQLRVVRVVAAVIQQGGLYLITQRRREAVLGGLWEFPGGRVEPDETDEVALRRELGHRIGIEPIVGDRLAEKHTPYADYEVTLALYSATSYSINTKSVGSDVYDTMRLASTSIRMWSSSVATAQPDASSSIYSQNNANISDFWK